MKVAIIGAGIGGLTTAIALQQAGIDFEIFEAASELRPVGAGIVMASNAMQVFQRLGIERKLMTEGREIEAADVADQSWKLISRLRVKELITVRYGVGSFAIHRGRLQQLLLTEIGPKKVSLNRKLSTLKQTSSGVSLTFEDGSVTESDIVIGADGIWSVVRKNLFGDTPLRYSGQTCWRGMATYSLPTDMRSNAYELWGNKKGLRFGFVSTAENEVYYFSTLFCKAGGKDDSKNLKKTLLEDYSCFGEIPAGLIEATPVESIIRSDLFDLNPIRQWWSGRVALLGDAAHATTPNLGQGGCQAVEDAWVIARCLKEQASVEKAYEQYQQIRYQKALRVVNTSWQLGQMTNLGNPLMRFIRNGVMRMIPERVSIKQLDKILNLDA